MPMVTAIELYYFVPPGKAPGQPDCRHARLRSRIAHADFLHAWESLSNEFRHPHFEGVGNSKTGSAFGRVLHCLNDPGMSMPKDSRTPCADVIDVFVAVHVPDSGSFGAVGKKWLSSHRPKSAHRGVHSPWNIVQCFFKESFGTRRWQHELRRNFWSYNPGCG